MFYDVTLLYLICSIVLRVRIKDDEMMMMIICYNISVFQKSITVLCLKRLIDQTN